MDESLRQWYNKQTDNVPDHTVAVVPGKQIKSRWGQWYRHDTVTVDDKPLEGFIQVRRRYLGKRFGHRMETTTCYKQTCVMGNNVEWLARQNGITLS
jgi:hypothetical protein